MANIFGLTRCSLWCSPPCCVFVSDSRNSTYSSLTNLESFTVIFVCFWHAHIPNCCVNNNHIVYTRDVGEVSPRWPQAQCCSSSSAWEVPLRVQDFPSYTFQFPKKCWSFKMLMRGPLSARYLYREASMTRKQSDSYWMQSHLRFSPYNCHNTVFIAIASWFTSSVSFDLRVAHCVKIFIQVFGVCFILALLAFS